MPLTATVVIPTFNRGQVLERCLAALLRQSSGTAPFDIIVVDDASSDDTERRVAALLARGGNLAYLRHATNRGRSATRNTGIRAATGEVVLLLDDDIVVEPDYVRSHRHIHDEAGDEHVAVVGNLSFPADILRRSNYAKYLQSRYLGYRRAGAMDGVDLRDLHPRFLGSGISSVRRSDLLEIGLFDETAASYGYEDHIFGQRLRETGIRLVFAPDARAVHLDDVTVEWYRAKMLETGRDGIPLLRERAPGFLEETGVAHLLPIEWRVDRGRRLMSKIAVHGLLNPATVWLLERWARATDHFGAVYSPLVYRALTAGGLLQGQRLERGGPRLVRYGV
jgi:GT2 family glycosyltransferase